MKKTDVSRFALTLFVLGLLLAGTPLLAQQTGSLEGVVQDSEGEPLPGVVITLTGNTLPGARTNVTNETGRFLFRGLPPGAYQVTVTLDGFSTIKRDARVLLDQTTRLNLTLVPDAEFEEELNVVAALPTIDPTSAEIKVAIPNETIEQLPVGQEYRDLVKLIPGVQYTEDGTRGPSAGGSGQDNVYLFDGANVTLPLFGTLSSEPSSHDIDQISVLRGGAQALDFNRSGGFTINSISKSGTGAFHGEVSYQIQTDGMTGDLDTGSTAESETDRDWSVFNIGGPIVQDKLFFYTSYYRPTLERTNRANSYGDVPDFDSERDEYYGKLTFSPTDSILLNGSYRTSEREQFGSGVSGATTAGTVSSGEQEELDIATVDGSWVINDKSFVTFEATSFENVNSGRPDNVLGFAIRDDGSVALDVANLDRQGLFVVPQPIAGQDDFNAFIAPLIERYGFLEGGARTGGGLVGVGSTFNDQDFAREAFEVGYDLVLGNHELHIGYQYTADEEDLSRTSNGWGLISVPGGRTTFNGQPVFYEARFEQQSLLSGGGAAVPPIVSEFESQSIEINDTISFDDWTINVGVMLSNDTYYGQGLRENSSNLSGFELAPGNRYKMYEIDFDEMIQPRLSVARAFGDGKSTAYASVARYNPAVSSLARAASWDRNLRRSIRGYFDAQGNLIGTDPVRSSSGKFFDDDLDPRFVDEYLVGYSSQLGKGWTAKAHARYRYAADFWEDTNNNARQRFDPPAGIPQELYIPDLDLFRAEIGGSSYVIAELDDAFTKYWEVGVEAEWQSSKAYFKGSYIWSHYYGNFDQDNTTTENDGNIFVGSSFIADGAGRQLWNFRYGDLRGDRRHQLKFYGYYNLNWNASIGAFGVFQSGQPWEAWDVEVYRAFTSSSSDTSRFAEPAGSRTTSDHYQLDLNYTQNFALGGRYNVQLRADVFNVFDRQTGYNIQNKVNSANFGESRRFFDPRRLQVAVIFSF